MVISEIRDRAFRILLGRTTTPPAGEGTRALEAFQSLIADLPGTLGVKWVDVVVEDNYTAGEDERVTMRVTGLTVTLPSLVYLTGEGVPTGTAYSQTTMRPPKDGARVQIIDQDAGTSTLHFWRTDLGAWVAASGLDATDESPLPAEMDRFLPAMLAVELQPEYGIDLGPVALGLADQGWRRLRARYGGRKAVAVDAALLCGSLQTHSRGLEDA